MVTFNVCRGLRFSYVIQLILTYYSILRTKRALLECEMDDDKTERRDYGLFRSERAGVAKVVSGPSSEV